MLNPNMNLLGRVDVDKELTSYLRTHLQNRPEEYTDDVIVSVTKPLNNKVPYVVITTIGGRDLDIFASSDFVDVEIAHSTRGAAISLASMVHALMVRAPLHVSGVSSVRAESRLLPILDEAQPFTFAQNYSVVSRAIVLPEVE